ncbi:MAG TPA: family 1 encapsulin nanocompartment shell protein [Polyangiaceae bacterium]|jgi:uncharacterized linocin/CFP29 family protein|nr:family 1 encapsulin nanocompartment shell protein [Polyangiaceae bacterium]
MSNEAQVPWDDEQWARVNKVIQDEASRARVAATFLPLYGPLAPSADFVRRDEIGDAEINGIRRLTINDKKVLQLSTLQVKVYLRGAQTADPDMESVLALFRRAANVLARLEDALVFNGQPGPDRGPSVGVQGLPAVWEVRGGERWKGLLDATDQKVDVARNDSESLVKGVSEAIGILEGKGQFGPHAVVLDQHLFLLAQTPQAGLWLPQDRIIPLLGGGSLLRSSTLPPGKGVVVALGGAPVELVVAKDVSLQFLQVTPDPSFVFRLYEKMVLRIKGPTAIVRLELPAAAGTPSTEAS